MRVLLTGDSFAPKLDGPMLITGNVIRNFRAGPSVNVYCSALHRASRTAPSWRARR